MKNFGIMLYVDDVQAEKEFWAAAGFLIQNESEIMGYATFDMKSHKESTCTFTVYDKQFIRENSPEVVDMQPSILFDCENLESLHEKISKATKIVNPITDVPFRHFNFATPNGCYYAVREV